ncbi:MAG: 4-hydroxyphenylpyruvate dioxygenase [Bacteroidetes bacterium CG2_30_33_31]|nr:MAG: 4-hydroxyphenylpyruvate dioxygenase [Bacteroidetes bacterium CG2_30_33_31]
MNQKSLPIIGTDYVEFYVGNAKQAAHFYQSAFGFKPLAYAGLETGRKDSTSYVLRQDKITFVLTAALNPKSLVAEHQKLHGDGVKIIALWVDDATKSYQETTSKGAKSYQEPKVISDTDGEVVTAGVYTYGETVHMFIERKNYNGIFLPGYVKWQTDYNPENTGLLFVDHIVGNVGWGEMDKVADYYHNIFGFEQLISFDDKDISTQYTALKSKVMTNDNFRIKFPINEPAKGLKKSQIEEFLDFYMGAGPQHVALATNNIIATINSLRSRGVDFLDVPDSYYDTVIDRVGVIEEDLEILKAHRILIDRDEEGYLLQLFTKPMQDRPTFFFEIIQRKGAKSFGKGNFKALFESIELEQGKRGTL